MAGMKVVVVRCDAQGNIDLADMREKVQAHAAELAALYQNEETTHVVL